MSKQKISFGDLHVHKTSNENEVSFEKLEKEFWDTKPAHISYNEYLHTTKEELSDLVKGMSPQEIKQEAQLIWQGLDKQQLFLGQSVFSVLPKQDLAVIAKDMGVLDLNVKELYLKDIANRFEDLREEANDKQMPLSEYVKNEGVKEFLQFAFVTQEAVKDFLSKNEDLTNGFMKKYDVSLEETSPDVVADMLGDKKVSKLDAVELCEGVSKIQNAPTDCNFATQEVSMSDIMGRLEQANQIIDSLQEEKPAQTNGLKHTQGF